MGKRVILIDFAESDDWTFKKALEESTNESWETVSCESNRLHGCALLKIRRYIKYFTFPFKIFINRNKFDSVIAWQQFYGLILAFYMKLFHVKSAPDITVMTFIYKPKKGLHGKMYSAFMNYVVHSGYIKRFIAFSESEASYYANFFGISETYFYSVALGIEDTVEEYRTDLDKLPKQTVGTIVDKKVYVSAGRSNRDYDFLCNSWGNIDAKLEIICDEEKYHNTDKITYYTDCHGEEYMKRLAQAHAVIIPLKNENISSGQLVMLQAMMLGKPIIVTRSNTVTDYIINGYNGLIIEKKEDALINAVSKLCDVEGYEAMCINSRKLYEEKFSIYAMGLSIGKIIKEV